ncbi:hypothetical protein ABBQ32_000960 [Trebouxia sp. C0010 RCD-2024]
MHVAQQCRVVGHAKHQSIFKIDAAMLTCSTKNVYCEPTMAGTTYTSGYHRMHVQAMCPCKTLHVPEVTEGMHTNLVAQQSKHALATSCKQESIKSMKLRYSTHPEVNS